MATKTFGAKRIIGIGLPAAAVLAGIFNVVFYLLVTGVRDRPMEFTMGSQEVGFDIPNIIIIGSIIPAIVGALVLMGLVRYVRRPVMVFYVIAAVILILSYLAGPFAITSDADYTKWVLVVMHSIAAASIAFALARSVPMQSSDDSSDSASRDNALVNNSTQASIGFAIGMAVGSVLYVLTDEAVWMPLGFAVGTSIGAGYARVQGRK